MSDATPLDSSSSLNSAQVSLQIQVAEKVNFAAWQNSIPTLKSVVIENDSTVDLSNVTLTLESSPAFTHPKTWHIANISAQSKYELSKLDIDLDPNYLQHLDEATRSILRFRLLQPDKILSEESITIRVLASNEWGGMGAMGDLLPAFITPNDPSLPSLLRDASNILEDGNYQPALDGYQSGDRQRVYMLAAALWSAVANKKLTYCNPPASFEKSGQKIRDVSTVLNERLATCLDSTILFASGLEAIGLNPVLIFQTGHCFVGVWLENKTFHKLIETDCSEVRKAISATELIVFETTLVTGLKASQFNVAVANASDSLKIENEDKFVCAIDVSRARMANIRPMASHRNRELLDEIEDSHYQSTLPDPPPMFSKTEVEEVPTTPEGRVDRWQRKLLDLSLRNSLLNFKISKKSIPLICPDISQLEDTLAAGTKLKIASIDESKPRGMRDAELHKQRTQQDIDLEYSKEALARNEILSQVDASDLESRLIGLLRATKSALAEGGSNTLFMAVGFLRWRPSNSSANPCKAPLLLIPVQLERKSVSSPFTLRAHEDEPRFNSTLVQMLKRDFGCDTSHIEARLPVDDHGVDVDRLLDMVRTAVRTIPGFEVIKEVTISQFSFSKFLMWRDLTDRIELLRNNRVVDHLVNSPDKCFRVEGLGNRPQSAEIDRRYRPSELVHPLPADSSQLSAVMAAAEGHDLVIIGPPGTGKSQTIANIIAQCLAVKKRVLFVAEKTAALDVVHRRLKERGLGDCCIELHSNKADKVHFVTQLANSWKNRSPESEAEWLRTTKELEQKRNQLNAYSNALHHPHPSGWTAYKAIGHFVKSHGQKLPKLPWSSNKQHSAEDYQAFEKLIRDMATAVKGMPADLKIEKVNTQSWTMAWEAKLMECCDLLDKAADAVSKTVSGLYRITGRGDFGDIRVSDMQTLLKFCQFVIQGTLPDPRLMALGDLDPIGKSLMLRQALLSRQSALVADLERILSELRQALGDKATATLTPERRRVILDIAKHFQNMESACQPLFLCSDLPSLQIAIESYEQIQDKDRTTEHVLESRGFNVHLLRTISIDALIAEGQAVLKSSWIVKTLKNRSFINKLRTLLIPGAAPVNTSVDLAILQGYLDAKAEIARSLEPIRALPVEYQKMCSENRGELLRLLEGAKRYRSLLQNSGVKVETFLEDNSNNFNGFVDRCRSLLSKFNEGQVLRENNLSNLSSLPLPDDYKKIATRNPNEVLEKVRSAAEFRKQLAIAKLIRSKSVGIQLSGSLEDLRTLGTKCLREVKILYALIQQYKDLTGCALVSSSSDGMFREIKRQVELLKLSKPHVKSHVLLNQVKSRAKELGLEAFYQLAYDERQDGKELLELFRGAYSCWILPSLVDASPALRNFQRVSHEEAVRQFREYDDLARNLASQRARLAVFHDLPVDENVPKKSELGILKHQSSLKKPSKSIRSMIEEMPTAFIKLTPCMLMSPLSIAQYLPANHPQFDVVIFDEASQIATWDAVGAIARGKQTIIVGDPKQLPPTNFFGRSNSEENEEIEDYEKDLESILDEACASGLPTLQLNWHYRSKHESLIAFSNWKYYGNHLVTFPAAESIDRGVEFHYVPNALYDRGGSRTNRKEAEAIVKHLCDRMRECLKKDPKDRLTYGVVTFNVNQQELIQDLLDAEYRKDPSLEWFNSDDRIEPTMVKNLESVQGDERDVMYFSITFGHSAKASVATDFGALNRSGGERRLNVAVTRARLALHVFASIHSSEVPIKRTQAKGVHDLAAFLDYAERGPEAVLEDGNLVQEDEFDSPFEMAVTEALRRRGWKIKTQVGVSGFRIDLGIYHPQKPGSYLAGIECDGASYHRSAVARDRDKIRQQILEGLGWTLLRVWSTDWCSSPVDATESLHRQLLGLLGEGLNTDVAELYNRIDRDSDQDGSDPLARPRNNVPVFDEEIFEVIDESFEDQSTEANVHVELDHKRHELSDSTQELPSDTAKEVPLDGNRSGNEVFKMSGTPADMVGGELTRGNVVIERDEASVKIEQVKLKHSSNSLNSDQPVASNTTIPMKPDVRRGTSQEVNVDIPHAGSKLELQSSSAPVQLRPGNQIGSTDEIATDVNADGPTATKSKNLDPIDDSKASVLDIPKDDLNEMLATNQFYRRSQIESRTEKADLFFEENYSEELVRYVSGIIQLLGPIREDLLRREIAVAHGFRKVGIRINERIQAVLNGFPSDLEGDWKFYWPEGIVKQIVAYRAPEGSDDIRSLEELPQAELTGFILTVYSSLDSTDPVIDIARRLNINRLVKNNRERIESALRQVEATLEMNE